MPQAEVDKKYVSCNNLMAIKNVQNKNSSRKVTDRRQKSLQKLHEELAPLLEAASSLSSIGSINELTEESMLDSSYSDESYSLDINKNKIVLRGGGKLRNLKHRPRSFAYIERNLGSIPENNLENNIKKRMFIQSLGNISGLENLTLMDIDFDDKETRNRMNNNNMGNANTSIKPRLFVSNCTNKTWPSLQNIAVPRRKSKPNVLTEAISTVSVSEQSFSKEQKRRLKKKMKDTKKSPENSVFLGLF